MTNPLLARVRLPGSTFRLPSGGLFYSNNELAPNVTNAEVHVYPMTAFDELLMKSPDMLFSGNAIREVFSRCIPDVQDPLSLLAKDVDYLLICLRVVTYGNTIPIKHKHDCERALEHEYMVDMQEFLRNSKAIDPTTLELQYSVSLPNEQLVRMEPIRYKHLVELMQLRDDNISETEAFKRSVRLLSHVIRTVDEVSDKELICDWLESIPAPWIHMLNNCIANTSDFGPSYTTSHSCEDCGSEFSMDTPFNPIAFFTSR